jgi:hypothetical protein
MLTFTVVTTIVVSSPFSFLRRRIASLAASGSPSM